MNFRQFQKLSVQLNYNLLQHLTKHLNNACSKGGGSPARGEPEGDHRHHLAHLPLPGPPPCILPAPGGVDTACLLRLLATPRQSAPPSPRKHGRARKTVVARGARRRLRTTAWKTPPADARRQTTPVLDKGSARRIDRAVAEALNALKLAERDGDDAASTDTLQEMTQSLFASTTLDQRVRAVVRALGRNIAHVVRPQQAEPRGVLLDGVPVTLEHRYLACDDAGRRLSIIVRDAVAGERLLETRPEPPPDCENGRRFSKCLAELQNITRRLQEERRPVTMAGQRRAYSTQAEQPGPPAGSAGPGSPPAEPGDADTGQAQLPTRHKCAGQQEADPAAPEAAGPAAPPEIAAAADQTKATAGSPSVRQEAKFEAIFGDAARPRSPASSTADEAAPVAEPERRQTGNVLGMYDSSTIDMATGAEHVVVVAPTSRRLGCPGAGTQGTALDDNAAGPPLALPEKQRSAEPFGVNPKKKVRGIVDKQKEERASRESQAQQQETAPEQPATPAPAPPSESPPSPPKPASTCEERVGGRRNCGTMSVMMGDPFKTSSKKPAGKTPPEDKPDGDTSKTKYSELGSSMPWTWCRSASEVGFGARRVAESRLALALGNVLTGRRCGSVVAECSRAADLGWRGNEKTTATLGTVFKRPELPKLATSRMMEPKRRRQQTAASARGPAAKLIGSLGVGRSKKPSGESMTQSVAAHRELRIDPVQEPQVAPAVKEPAPSTGRVVLRPNAGAVATDDAAAAVREPPDPSKVAVRLVSTDDGCCRKDKDDDGDDCGGAAVDDCNPCEEERAPPCVTLYDDPCPNRPKKKKNKSKKNKKKCKPPKKKKSPCGKKKDPCKPKKKPCDPCAKKEEDPCEPDPCPPEDPCAKIEEDPCKPKKDPCKPDPCPKKEDPCKPKKDPCPKKEDPCKPKKDPCPKKEDPCKPKKDPCPKKEDPCKPKKDPCKPDPCPKKEDPCKPKKDPCPKKEDPCKPKKDPCPKKEDPCKPKKDPCKPDPCPKKEDPCKPKKDPCKPDPCPKKEDPCKPKKSTCKPKSDPCKPKKDPCKPKKDPCKPDPCAKKEDPCKPKKDPCKPDPCAKKDPCPKKEDPCKPKKDPCPKKKDPCKPAKQKKSPCKPTKKKSPCPPAKKKDPCAEEEDPCAEQEDPCAEPEDPCAKKKKDPCKKADPCGQKEPAVEPPKCGPPKPREDPCNPTPYKPNKLGRKCRGGVAREGKTVVRIGGKKETPQDDFCKKQRYKPPPPPPASKKDKCKPTKKTDPCKKKLGPLKRAPRVLVTPQRTSTGMSCAAASGGDVKCPGASEPSKPSDEKAYRERLLRTIQERKRQDRQAYQDVPEVAAQPGRPRFLQIRDELQRRSTKTVAEDCEERTRHK